MGLTHLYVEVCVGGWACVRAASVHTGGGDERLASLATLISCVTYGKLLNFSEPNFYFPNKNWGNNHTAWVTAWL